MEGVWLGWSSGSIETEMEVAKAGGEAMELPLGQVAMAWREGERCETVGRGEEELVHPRRLSLRPDQAQLHLQDGEDPMREAEDRLPNGDRLEVFIGGERGKGAATMKPVGEFPLRLL